MELFVAGLLHGDGGPKGGGLGGKRWPGSIFLW